MGQTKNNYSRSRVSSKDLNVWIKPKITIRSISGCARKIWKSGSKPVQYSPEIVHLSSRPLHKSGETTKNAKKNKKKFGLKTKLWSNKKDQNNTFKCKIFYIVYLLCIYKRKLELLIKIICLKNKFAKYVKGLNNLHILIINLIFNTKT